MPAYLVPNNEGLSIWRPGKGKCLPESPDLVDTCLCANVPELDHSINAHATKFRILDGIKSNLLNWGRVTL